jgi:hypothetical protein
MIVLLFIFYPFYGACLLPFDIVVVVTKVLSTTERCEEKNIPQQLPKLPPGDVTRI